MEEQEVSLFSRSSVVPLFRPENTPGRSIGFRPFSSVRTRLANGHGGTRARGHTHSTDARYMARALTLARRALGRTSPNPPVGAVVVAGDRIVGEGHHRYAGASHAEVGALRAAGVRARGATLYVTLEPCNHTGRTPPCCDAILASGVSRIVVATADPNPITDGKGIARLRRAGLRVSLGTLRDQAQALIAPFSNVMRRGLPLVTAKVGQSLDGKIATRTGDARWITSPASRRLIHQWRSQVDAILIGVNTALSDDPLLTVRSAPQRAGRPIKVILDSRLRIPITARCLSAQSPAPSIIATAVAGGAKRDALVRRGVEVLSMAPRAGRIPLETLFRLLARRGIQSILIEGGGEVLASAFAERLVDRVAWCIAPLLIGGRHAVSSVGGAGVSRLAQAVRLTDVVVSRVGPDLCVQARVVYPRNFACLAGRQAKRNF